MTEQQRAARASYAAHHYAPGIAKLSDKTVSEFHASNLTHAPDLAHVTAAELQRRGIDPATITPAKLRRRA
jgi:hypothetical protein